MRGAKLSDPEDIEIIPASTLREAIGAGLVRGKTIDCNIAREGRKE